MRVPNRGIADSKIWWSERSRRAKKCCEGLGKTSSLFIGLGKIAKTPKRIRKLQGKESEIDEARDLLPVGSWGGEMSRRLWSPRRALYVKHLQKRRGIGDSRGSRRFGLLSLLWLECVWTSCVVSGGPPKDPYYRVLEALPLNRRGPTSLWCPFDGCHNGVGPPA